MDEEKKPEERGSGIPTQPSEPIMPSEVPAEVQKEPEQIAQATQVFVPKKSAAGAEAKPSRWLKLREFFVECKRVLRVTKKPDAVEFKTIVKISGIGIAAIGLIGFLVHFIKELMF